MAFVEVDFASGGSSGGELLFTKISDASSTNSQFLDNKVFNVKKGRTYLILGHSDQVTPTLTPVSGAEIFDEVHCGWRESWGSYNISCHEYFVKATADTMSFTSSRLFSWIIVEVSN